MPRRFAGLRLFVNDVELEGVLEVVIEQPRTSLVEMTPCGASERQFVAGPREPARIAVTLLAQSPKVEQLPDGDYALRLSGTASPQVRREVARRVGRGIRLREDE